MTEPNLRLLAAERIADADGRPLLSFLAKWQRLLDRLEAAETTLDDHETRIVALEP